MIDSIVNLLFRCPHRRLTRPVTPVSRSGAVQGQTYVVCLDCGKQFAYDYEQMRIGKPLESTHDGGVLHPEMPKPRGQKLKYALWMSLPVAILAGSIWKNKNPAPGSKTAPSGSEPEKAGKDPRP